MTDLSVSRCTECGAVHVTEPVYCDCGSELFTTDRIPPTGQIVSHTTIHVAPPEFEAATPYTIAVVDLDKGPHVTARVTNGLGVATNDAVVIERRNSVQHWVVESNDS